MNLEEKVNSYKEIGYNQADAVSKVAQDVVLLKISKSKYAKNITVKGGVVMHSISDDVRRATRDMDLDFIKYSLANDSIIRFIEELSNLNDGIKLEVDGDIVELHQQDYDGKRVFIKIVDENDYEITTKLDIGVHKLFDIEQEDYCFDLNIFNDNANLLINSKEQIFTEKLKSLLKIGVVSTRYKDVFDFYFLINVAGLDKNKLLNCFNILIFEDSKMKENSKEDIYKRLSSILNSNIFKSNLSNPKNNWLEADTEQVINNVLEFISNL